MGTLKTNNVQVGQSVTATNNFTLYQPTVPDGTVRLGVGNSGATTADVLTANSSGNVGIGTSSPDRRLTVSSSGATYAKITTTATNQIAFEAVGGDGNGNYFGVDTSGGGAFGAGAYGRVIYCSGAYPLVIATNGTEQARITAAGVFQFNSGYGSSAAAYGCRAWVNFNGTGTVAIRASGNVTSITDNGVGLYTVNFTNAMPDANYATTIGVGERTNDQRVACPMNETTTSVQIGTRYQLNLGSRDDSSDVSVSIFR